MTARPGPSTARHRRVRFATATALLILLAACGGGNGGGGNGNGASAYELKVAVINETLGDISVSLDALEPGEPATLATCTATVYEYQIPVDDWVLVVNGQTIIDSLTMASNLVDGDLISEVSVAEDGTVTLVSLARGRLIGAPAQLGICN